MKTVRQANLLMFVLVALCSCVDVFEYEIQGDDQETLIVNGGVTTLPGPQQILVYRSKGFGNPDAQPAAVRDATVYVTDDEGNRFDYVLTSDPLQTSDCVNLAEQLGPTQLDLTRGYRYISDPTFSAVVGRSYTVHVELADGTLVSSTPELAEAAIPINSIETTYVVDETLGEGSSTIPDDKWIVQAQLQSNQVTGDPHLTWRHKGTFLIRTNPEQFCDFTDCSSVSCIPSCCNECWVVEYGQSLVNTDASTVEGLSENYLTVATIPIEAMKTLSIYHLDLYQYRISDKTYDFFEALSDQLTNQGSIFDPPPHDEPSNLSYDDGRDEPILGFFWAAGAIHEVVTISPTIVTRQYNYFFPDDCQRVPGASTNRPEYYVY
ncbi:MAG: DUF4249 family protein [Bacteroidota bacterium]